MESESVEEKIDHLLNQEEDLNIEADQPKKPFFKRKKLLGIPIGLIVLLVAGIVIASMIGYIMTVDIEGSKMPVKTKGLV